MIFSGTHNGQHVFVHVTDLDSFIKSDNNEEMFIETEAGISTARKKDIQFTGIEDL